MREWAETCRLRFTFGPDELTVDQDGAGRFDIRLVIAVFFGTGWGLLWLAERFGLIEDAFRNG